MHSGALTVGLDPPAVGFQVGTLRGSKVINPTGFEIDLAKAIARKLGIPAGHITWEKVPFDTLFLRPAPAVEDHVGVCAPTLRWRDQPSSLRQARSVRAQGVGRECDAGWVVRRGAEPDDHPNLVALSVTTLLLSTLSRSLRAGDSEGARALATNAIRGVFLLFPFAGVAAGAATAVSTMIYGAEFAAIAAICSRR